VTADVTKHLTSRQALGRIAVSPTLGEQKALLPAFEKIHHAALQA
jgi:hypothetical protein